MGKLINIYRFELVEDHHHSGSGRFGLTIGLSEDISDLLPYLNTVLDDTYYDEENQILIGSDKKRRYAFRSHEIQVGAIVDASNASYIACETIDLVNQVWQERDRILPSLKERKVPTTYAVFRLLPKANCMKLCECLTCLAFAEELRSGKARLEQCPLLSTPEYEDKKRLLTAMFSGR